MPIIRRFLQNSEIMNLSDDEPPLSWRFLVVGVGAVGALIAARLGSVANLTLVVRSQASRECIAKGGLSVVDADGTTQVKALHPKDVRVVASVDEVCEEVFDFVIVACKLHQLPALAPSLKALAANDCKTTFLFAQNGVPFFFPQSEDISDAVRGHKLTSVDPSGALADAVPVSSCLGCALFVCGEIVGDDDSSSSSDVALVVKRTMHGNARERIHIGAPTKDTHLMSKARELVHVLCVANLDALLIETPAELWTVMFNKLMGNVSYNFISALTLCDMGVLSSTAVSRKLAGDVMAEARAVGQACGVSMMSPEDRLKMSDTKHPVRPSTLQDLIRKRPMEIDILNALIELAQVLKVDTPRMTTLAVLTQLRGDAVCYL